MARVVCLPRLQAIHKTELDECGCTFERTWVASRRNAGLAPRDYRGDVFCDTAPGFGVPSLCVHWHRAVSESCLTNVRDESQKTRNSSAYGPRNSRASSGVATQQDGKDGYLINGVKTWCTFAARANVLMLLARTDPDRAKSHKGLSVLIVPKPRGEAHGFVFNQPNGGRMEGRPIDTIGYRGMHSYEIAIENWWVPADHLIGETAGLGKGFYYQMEGFENGRLQTAARAVGVMQAAYEAACDYAQNRKSFGKNIGEYQIIQAKLGRMAVVIQGSRQFSYAVAKLMGKGEGAMEASMVKAYVCKAAEWVTREAMQIHGGYGYAEEYSVSRLFVDARVLSIFEGADETLCLKVIARRLVETAK
ncbi:MAG: acyl-CoA dehydrogenase [Acidimicrobiia bacterium]|nr:acyl-CoA dehydrogenase [Acidimicrobiia bacterium]NDD72058.1 acyl-CoA dehydrogenase [Actinomycetota bacterium]